LHVLTCPFFRLCSIPHPLTPSISFEIIHPPGQVLPRCTPFTVQIEVCNNNSSSDDYEVRVELNTNISPFELDIGDFESVRTVNGNLELSVITNIGSGNCVTLEFPAITSSASIDFSFAFFAKIVGTSVISGGSTNESLAGGVSSFSSINARPSALASQFFFNPNDPFVPKELADPCSACLGNLPGCSPPLFSNGIQKVFMEL